MILFNIPLWAFPAYQQKASNAAAARSGASSIYLWKCVLNPVRIISLKNSTFISYFIFCSAVISPTENCNWGPMIRILWAIWVMLSLNEKMRDSIRTQNTSSVLTVLCDSGQFKEDFLLLHGQHFRGFMTEMSRRDKTPWWTRWHVKLLPKGSASHL